MKQKSYQSHIICIIKGLLIFIFCAVMLCGCRKEAAEENSANSAMNDGVQTASPSPAPTDPDGGYQEAFQRLQQGDWSEVVPFDGMEGLMEEDDLIWQLADVSGDNIPELVSLYKWLDSVGQIPVNYIFAYIEGKIELIYSDTDDYNEYCFLNPYGDLIYMHQSYGQMDYICYANCRFHADWNLTLEDSLFVSYFYEDKSYSEKTIDYLKELYPDTYGKGGSGIYYYRCLNETITELMTKDKFFEAYLEMTGTEFEKVMSNWTWRIEKAERPVSNPTGKLEYAYWKPDLFENEYVDAIREKGDYDENYVSHTYEADFDGDGGKEAFVIMGKASDYFYGDIWFVDSQKTPVLLEKLSRINETQQYIKEGKQIYFFFTHDIGVPYVTDVYTVEDGRAIMAIDDDTVKYVDDYGHVLVTQSAYDHFYEENLQTGNVMYYGHTWKDYPFIFENGKLTEIGAHEVSRQEAAEISSFPAEVEEMLQGDEINKVAGTQFILRDNGELNINIAYQDTSDEDSIFILFQNATCTLDENNQWILTDQNDGTYLIQFSTNSHWEFRDGLKEENLE